jgi:prepilin-type N-terminal cleavage/methylation domain-containing protein
MASVRQKKREYLSGIKPGFTLIELLVAIALLGVVAALVLPNLKSRGSVAQREEFAAKVNALTKFAWQNAIVSRTTQRVEFDFQQRKITVTQETGEQNMEGKKVFGPVKRAYLNTSISIPPQFDCKNFYVEGFDEMGRFQGRKTEAVWFYLIPEGLAQSVIINIADTKDRAQTGKIHEMSLVLNPFSAQFDVYDMFKQP